MLTHGRCRGHQLDSSCNSLGDAASVFLYCMGKLPALTFHPDMVVVVRVKRKGRSWSAMAAHGRPWSTISVALPAQANHFGSGSVFVLCVRTHCPGPTGSPTTPPSCHVNGAMTNGTAGTAGSAGDADRSGTVTTDPEHIAINVSGAKGTSSSRRPN